MWIFTACAGDPLGGGWGESCELLWLYTKCSAYGALSNVYDHLFLKRFYLFNFRERGREGEREGEKHQCVVASHTPPNWGPGPQPRHVPCWELNQRPFGSQAGTQSTELRQPGLSMIILKRRHREPLFGGETRNWESLPHC